MKNSGFRCLRGVVLSGVTLLALTLAALATAAHRPPDEAGRWVGFVHSDQTFPPGPPTVVLDLTVNANAGPSLVGSVTGLLPAVQNGSPITLTVGGSVSRDGQLRLELRGQDANGGAIRGFCDGSVRLLDNFSQAGDPDVIAGMDFLLSDAGVSHHGHFNAIHLYGGLDWANIVPLNTVVGGPGSFVAPSSNHADVCNLVAGNGQGSFFNGQLSVGGGDTPLLLNMLGTTNAMGSTVMMCDGSVRVGDRNALIGLLFTGGVMPPGVAGPGLVGNFGDGSFGQLLPAVQRARLGAMSFLAAR